MGTRFLWLPSVPEVSTPTATYRLQFHAGFTLRDAERLVPYLHALGVSHVYCSPYLKARAGSTHGYDITDHNALNPEVGEEESFSAFVETLQRHGMGQILDFVPNHVGIGGHENLWWLDVLEYGPSSPYAEFFDIDWEPAKVELRRKVLLPFLGDHYGQVLERGELELRFDSGAGSLSVWYHEHRFPITPRSYPRVLSSRSGELGQGGSPDDPDLADLRALLQAFRELAPPGAPARRRATLRQEAEEAKAALASLARARPAIAAHIEEAVGEINGSPGDRRSFESLHRLLEAQHYRLAYWRVAADEVNYRRFFDINELAGLRVDREDLFELTHHRVFEWIERGQVHGLRIDHIDGLADPRAYCQRIRQRFLDRRLYLVVEKILARHEKLRPDWPVDGTTGYEFLNLVNGLLIDPAGERPLDRTYQRFADRSSSFDDILYTSKKNAMSFLLGSELQVLANQLDRIAESDWRTRDFTLTAVKEALKEIIACFPVYRTYVSPLDTHPDDRREIERAVEGGASEAPIPNPACFIGSSRSSPVTSCADRDPIPSEVAWFASSRSSSSTRRLSWRRASRTPASTVITNSSRSTRWAAIRDASESQPRTSTRQTRSAPPTGRARCSRPRLTTPSAARTCALESTCSPRFRENGERGSGPGRSSIAGSRRWSRDDRRRRRITSISSIRP